MKRTPRSEVGSIWLALRTMDLASCTDPSTGDEWLKLVCPFHQDTNPSASTNGQYFICFACGVKGDAISLLMRQGGMTYSQSLVALKLDTDSSQPSTQRRKSLFLRGAPNDAQ